MCIIILTLRQIDIIQPVLRMRDSPDMIINSTDSLFCDVLQLLTVQNLSRIKDHRLSDYAHKDQLLNPAFSHKTVAEMQFYLFI